MTPLLLLAVSAWLATAEVVSSESQRLTQHGDAQLAAGNAEDAVESYRAAIAADGHAFEARVNLGAALVAAGDIDGAIESMQAADKARPGSAPVLRNLGRALMARERWSDAVDPLRRAHDADPSSFEATRLLGIALERAGSHQEAIGLLKPAAASHPPDAELLLELASAQISTADPAASATLDRARKAAGSGRAGAKLRNEIALRLRELGRIKEALDEFRAAARLDPTYSPAVGNLGMALVEAGEWANAKGTLETAARNDNDPQLRYFLGQAKLETGDAKGAIADLEEARSWGYDPKAIAGMLARCWETLGQTANADGERAKAGIPLQGKGDDAKKGYDLLQKGDLPKAIERLAAATKADPQDYPSEFNLGLAHLKMGDAAGAIAPLREAAAGLAEQEPVWYALATAYEKAADLPHASGAWTEMLQRFPRRADVSAHLGHLLLEMGQTAQALDRLRDAAKALPKDPSIRYDLAVALVQMKHPDQALSPLKAYLAARADDREAREAYARALADSGDEKNAAAEFARLNAVQPLVARFAINAAVAWRKAGDAGQERLWLEKAATLAPDDAAVANDLGRLQFAAKEWDAAAATFARAAALDPSNTNAAANAETARKNAAIGQMKETRFHLRVIVVKDEKVAKSVQRRLAAGEDFAKIAKALSTHESAPAGGDLGWVDPATLPDWAAPAKALKTGERSATMPLAGGFAIFERL